MKIIERNQGKIKAWAENAPMNFLHKYHLVEAELNRVQGNQKAASDYYDQAINGAVKNEFIQDAAIACECAARFWLSLGKEKIAEIYMGEAFFWYTRGGAEGKVKSLKEKYIIKA